MKNSITKVIRNLFILIFWIIIWELSSLFINNSILLPFPLDVFKTLISLIKQVYFWKSILQSIIRVIIGLFLSITIGIVLGIIAGINKYVEEFLQPLIIFIKATPVMSIIIIALVWFRSESVAIFTNILICFPIIYTNVVQGIKSVDTKLIEMSNLYKVKKKYIIKDIYLPFVKSYIISGTLMCLGIGWKVTVASEVLSTPKYSIGFNLLNAKGMLDIEELFAWTIVVVLLSFLFEVLFKMYINRKNI